MQEGSKGRCASTSHRLMKDNAKNRLNDLQGRFAELQVARKEGRANDVASLEEKVNQSLLEWNDELNAPSPATSLLDDGLESFSNDTSRMSQFYEEQNDATSPGHNVQSLNQGALTSFPDLRKKQDLLVHASQCRVAPCLYPNCRKVKGLFRHGISCKIRPAGGCVLCKNLWCLLQLHSRACKESECNVPRCRDIKEHLRRLQQQSDSRPRAAVMEMMRQSAAVLVIVLCSAIFGVLLLKMKQ